MNPYGRRPQLSWRKKPEETQLDRLIAQYELDIQMEEDPKKAAKMVKNLEGLYSVRSKNAPNRISPETWLIVGGNLAGILIIVGYEHGHVIGSKALNQIGKLR
jgi:hypothetical protein